MKANASGPLLLIKALTRDGFVAELPQAEYHNYRNMDRGRVPLTTTITTSHTMGTIQLIPSPPFWFTEAYIFDIGHPCHGQLTFVKTRYPLTSIT